MMLNVRFSRFWPNGWDRENIPSFYFLKLCKTCDTWDRVNFGPMANILRNLADDLQDEAM